MAKFLTQEEIDALLSTVATAGADSYTATTQISQRTAAVYDFKHPNRISKDQVRTLENIHDNFGGHLSSALSGVLRAVVDVDLVSVDQITYSEFFMSLASPSCTYTFSMKPLDGLCVADISPSLAFGFVDRMFGGRGKSMDTDRELTGIELSVVDKIIARAWRELASAWNRVVEVEIATAGFETTPQFIQIVPPGETVIVTTLQLNVLETSGIVKLCYPYITLEPIITKLLGQNWTESSRVGGSDADRLILRDSIKQVETEAVAVLANAEITVRDFLNIHVGDVLVADTRSIEPSRVNIAGLGKFVARPGLRGKHRAIEIVSFSTD